MSSILHFSALALARNCTKLQIEHYFHLLSIKHRINNAGYKAIFFSHICTFSLADHPTFAFWKFQHFSMHLRWLPKKEISCCMHTFSHLSWLEQGSVVADSMLLFDEFFRFSPYLSHSYNILLYIFPCYPVFVCQSTTIEKNNI